MKERMRKKEQKGDRTKTEQNTKSPEQKTNETKTEHKMNRDSISFSFPVIFALKCRQK